MMVHTNPILYILLSYQVQSVCTHDYAFGVHTVGKNVPMANDFTSRFIASMALALDLHCLAAIERTGLVDPQQLPNGEQSSHFARRASPSCPSFDVLLFIEGG